MKPPTLVLVLVASHALAQSPTPPASQWRATVKVIDEEGQAVVGAKVEIGYYVPPPPGRTEAAEKIRGETDRSGFFVASHADTRSVSLSFLAAKAGYYSATLGRDLGFQYDASKWNPTVTLLLKKTVAPIPMYAKRIRQGPPVANRPVGYDLEVGDWVSPFGEGKSTDIMFAAHLGRGAGSGDDYMLVVSFPNPEDGIQPFATSELERTSRLRSLHQAPETGYTPQWTKTRSRESDGHPAQDKSRIFFVRVRTVLDDQGKVKRANYGKIYGDFMDFQYFFNPQANSRNVEFDPASNLLQKVGPAERVLEP